jgi:hypothetical protein
MSIAFAQGDSSNTEYSAPIYGFSNVIGPERATVGRGNSIASRLNIASGSVTGPSWTMTFTDDFITWHGALNPAPVGGVTVTITDVANSGETPGAGSESWDDGSSGNVITGTGFLG